ncbi:uncharacterized protein K460DRAFT_409538 [Cucurbitaria berberidis CBS 394.84]|uniref:Heterokaryon incompatibility domain-containing protein n=1 Tax=Cucurbitaria berberidis CBS 394.84 TaxID=1168544 RepID=A0A9P4GAP3_9PLEO|nr:uncharacterized protein K460DRAFT_409538 [Cucurbitaria berberidis CBS 394.84]KAF1842115.1 hypothetical protein K460DRAFT_409538 [Cucurbitaria berberidis CBS 394.84]
MEYSYTPLQDVNSIRLLQLEPGYGNAPLKAHLATYRLEEHYSYDALSYVWGEPDLFESIVVNDRTLHISKNLHTILLQLRLPDEIGNLWIDAVCINQQDDIEKGQQVAIMGQIYQQANTTLCWIGQLSTHRLWALKFLQKLADEAPQYSTLCEVGPFWTVTAYGDILQPGVDVDLVVEAALQAHVEAIYESDWFTRLWIVQELALASNPKILCGAFSLSWDEFDSATRIIMSCLFEVSSPPKAMVSIKHAWYLSHRRAKHSLNMRTINSPQIVIDVDPQWSTGGVAWDMRNKKCKDDRDRVYALLSLAVSGNGLKLFVPDAFVPDYTRPVEWVYREYWRRYGGPKSLFYAGLSRRRDHRKPDTNRVMDDAASTWFNDNYLPSWAPELRTRHTEEWKPIFGSDYGTSTTLQYKGYHFTNAPSIIMIRGHRFDVVARGFHISHRINPSQSWADFVDLRTTIISLLSLESKYEPYPSGQTWTGALGSTLMTDMPYNHEHPFQRYLNAAHLNIRLSDSELCRIWKLYLELFLAENGAGWKEYCSVAGSAIMSRRGLQFHSSGKLKHDCELVGILHSYIGDVLQAHRLVITKRGYMGLAPPDTTVGDVVVAFGGPNVPFVVRDVGELVANGARWSVSAGGIQRNLSQLLGPCYLQGIMRTELMNEERYRKEFEWEINQLGMIPKPTLHLI